MFGTSLSDRHEATLRGGGVVSFYEEGEAVGAYQVITPPALEPISAAEAKLHTKISHAVEDAAFTRWILAARQLVEKEARRALITQTVLQVFRMPAEYVTSSIGPVQGFDDQEDPLVLVQSGTATILTPANYYLTDSDPPDVRAAAGVLSTVGRDAFLRVRLIVGYGDAADDVPEVFKQAILQTVGEWYLQRGSVAGLSDDVKKDLSLFRKVYVA